MSKTIGILGGLGPYAGIDVSTKILDNTVVYKDSEHINQLLISFSREISDRSEFLLDKIGPNPAYAAIELIQKMISIGVDIVAIACNQMHSRIIWAPIASYISENTNIKLVNIIQEVVLHLEQSSIKGNIGIIGRTGIIKQRIYANHLAESGYDVYTHNDSWQEKIDQCVASDDFGIKKYPHPINPIVIDTLNSFINHLRSQNVKTIILACTEIPFAIDTHTHKDITFIDASDILARALVREADPERLLPNTEYMAKTPIK